MSGRPGSGRLAPALLAGGAALAIVQGAPGLTALAPVRRLFPGWRAPDGLIMWR